MAKKNISKALKALQGQWKEAEPRTFTTIPDADYVAKLTEMSVDESANGRIQVVTTFVVADGKMKGKEVKKFDGIASDKNMEFFKGFCQVLGIEIPEDITDLPEVLDEFVGEFKDLVNIKAITKDEYQNIRVTGLSEYEADEDSDDEDSDEEDEPSSKKKKKSSKDEDEDEDEEEDSDDDDEDEPKKKKGKNKKK